jgi:hypothetical protein
LAQLIQLRQLHQLDQKDQMAQLHLLAQLHQDLLLSKYLYFLQAVLYLQECLADLNKRES